MSIVTEHRTFAAFTLCAALCAPGLARPQDETIPLPPPPPRVELPATAPPTDAELLARLAGPERQMFERERDARGKFDALIKISDLRLDDIRAHLDAGDASLGERLRLYEGVLLAADHHLRSPQADVQPRDKRFKRFEQKLTDHIKRLKSLVGELSAQDLDIGTSIQETATRLRVAALHSALDVKDILKGGE